MDIKKLQATVIHALEDVKAQDIVLFDTTKLTSLFDRMVIATGTSNRQTRALADSVREKVREAGGAFVGMEGGETGEWVLVDLGDMLVHIMQPAIRSYYHLEEIWGGKKIALSTAKRAARTPATTTDTEKKPVRKTTTRTKASTTTGEKTAAKAKSPVKKTAETSVKKTAGTAVKKTTRTAAPKKTETSPATRAKKSVSKT